VFLTGHTGFKGAWAVLLLNRLGARVTGFSLPGQITTPDLFHAADIADLCTDLRGDVRDLDALKAQLAGARPDIVLHMAAQAIVRLGLKDPVDTIDVNVLGVAKMLEAVRQTPGVDVCAIVTSDKCYENRERIWAYREDEAMGGKDPYSASKGAAELITAAFARSYFADGPTRVISLRSGNVIGGGDWAEDRIVPDAMRALAAGERVGVRRPEATRPWQHVLEPLGGYLLLAEKLANAEAEAGAFNFGPPLEANRSVRELVEAALGHWPSEWEDRSDPQAPHEAGRLHLQIDKAHHQLGWQPRWPFATTVERTVGWYRAVHEGANPMQCCLADLQSYQEAVGDAR
jgi:CDP-glucose 4,6-dehydratase